MKEERDGTSCVVAAEHYSADGDANHVGLCPRRPCTVGGCAAVSRARGYCSKHYERWRKHGDTSVVARPRPPSRVRRPCSIARCSKPAKARGWCAMHYRRWRIRGDPYKVDTVRAHPSGCQVPGCTQRYCAKGYCATHYWRWREHGDPLYEPRVPGKRWKTSDGYVALHRPGHPLGHQRTGAVLEHRLVMFELLDRPLRPGENVHQSTATVPITVPRISSFGFGNSHRVSGHRTSWRGRGRC
jgi:hypothetical protein